jgi:proline dehydrogenase
LEARRRIKALLERLRTERFNPSPERLRVVRVVEVLERIGDAESRRILSALARGAPEAQLTTEAKTALERLDQTSTDGP